MDQKQLIPVMMAMRCMEEIANEFAKTMDSGLARNHSAGDVSYITYGSCKHKPSQKGSIHFCI